MNRQKTILIVDDEVDFLDNLKQFFMLHGYRCLGAVDGRKALEQMDEHAPDLVMIDVLMPQVDGYTFVREMQRRDLKAKCIVITAKKQLKDLFRLEHIDAFFEKPVDLDALLVKVESLLS